MLRLNNSSQQLLHLPMRQTLPQTCNCPYAVANVLGLRLWELV
jgi:hypothetical protein